MRILATLDGSKLSEAVLEPAERLAREACEIEIERCATNLPNWAADLARLGL